MLISTLFFASCSPALQSQNELAPGSAEPDDTQSSTISPTNQPDPTELPPSTISGEITDTTYSSEGILIIKDIGDFSYDAKNIITVRDDLFNNGNFSVFDILVHLDNTNQIAMEYYFDETMNTHIIETINQLPNWWYVAYYDGGWPENNIFRMDHFPYKDNMFITVFQIDEEDLNKNYAVFKEEVARKKTNKGKTIIPTVLINGQQRNIEFNNITIEAHDLRTDVFVPGSITAMDVIMTLGDQDLISYDLQWYESIGSAGIVKDYFVNRINDDTAFNRCGFVYEAGAEENFLGRGNHIHIPPDTRLLNSPEYVQFFWICI